MEFAPRLAGRSCLPPALVLGFERGELPADLAPAVAEHVTGCVLCRTLARDLVSLQDTAPVAVARQRVRERVLPPPSRSRRWGWWLAAPAAAAILAVTALLSWNAISRRPAADRTIPVASVATPRSVTPAPAPPLVVSVPKPPVMLPASVLVFRGQGSGGGEQAMLQAFGTAIAPYREDRFDEAAGRLREFTRRYPSMAEGFFYLGVSQLLAGRPAEARPALERARRLSRPPFRDQVGRYLELSRR